MNFRDKYAEWLANEYFDKSTKDELLGIADDEKEIEERFYKNLEFGTAGLRGIIGAGTNRMNIYTVRKASQGLANYILKNSENGREMGVCIAYDPRRFSREFAEAAALCFCGNGIKAYLFESLRPTPELSFSVRRLGCIAGVVVTASHNPPEYNGYKVYWEDGGQVIAPRDVEIIGEVNAIDDFSQIKSSIRKEALSSGLLKIIGADIDGDYIENVKKQIINPCIINAVADRLTIVYTPLNGTGSIPVRQVLAEAGFSNVIIVPEQEEPDPDFSSVGSPNPEDPSAFTRAIELAENVEADLIIATDPDCDRLGVVVKDNDGGYVFLSGNIVGVILADYILSQKKQNGTLPSNAAVVSTIVSTDMTRTVCKAHGAAYFEVYTGFKYIAEKIREFEESGEHEFIFGFEESIGYLAGTHARDKDAVVSSLLLCEAAAYYKSRGMTLYGGIAELYGKYGYFRENTKSLYVSGVSGLEKIKKAMAELRANPLSVVGDVKITEWRDYLTGTVKTGGGEADTGMPASDVLYYVLEDGGWFAVRPSGTEPKIKIYCGICKETAEAADESIKKLTAAVTALIEIK